MTKLNIVQKVLALLNITEEGKIENFFMKQRKSLEKDIKNLNKNLDTIKDQYQDSIEELHEKIEDARTRVSEAYTSIKIEDIDTNEKANSFADMYWDRISIAEAAVEKLEKQGADLTERHSETVENIKKEIAERERRLDMIS